MSNPLVSFLLRHRMVTALALLVVLLHGFGWWMAAQEMQCSVDKWVDDQRATGLVVTHGKVSVGGYPFFLRARAPQVSISKQGRWRWDAVALDIDLSPLALNQLSFRPRDVQTIEAQGFGAWVLEAVHANVQLADDGDENWRMEADFKGMQFATRDGGFPAQIAVLGLTAGPEVNDPHSLHVTADIRQFLIQTERGLIEAPKFELDLVVGAIDKGVAITLRQLDVEVEGTKAIFSGVLTLDATGHPEGLIEADIEQPAGLARLIGKTGALTSEEASMAEAGLAMASLLQGGRIKGPIVLSNGEATLAGVKIADLPKFSSF